MKYSRLAEELTMMVEKARPLTKEGKVADYIPALKKEQADQLSLFVLHVDGTSYHAGDYLKKFTLQSISKVLSLAIVLIDLGPERVFEKVGMEPSGDPFNSIVKLETMKPPVKPMNPMINAGALAVTEMIPGKNSEEKWRRLTNFISELIDQDVSVNETVAKSEFETSFINRALCYFLKQHEIIIGDVEELLAVYTKQCALEVNCQQLARIGTIFALNGKDPKTSKQIIPKDIARICKTYMVTCGMYDASGQFAIEVGIPAKSGVSGGILGVVPQQCGIGIFSPALDDKGNSVAGMKLLEIMSERFDWSIF